MTDKLSAYSTTAASNNSAAPDGWPENMAPSDVNDCAREMMARLREWYQDAQWVDLGHTIASSTGSTIVVSGDQTAYYTAGRAIRTNQNNSNIGYVSSSSYSAPNTTINVVGFTVSSPTQVEVGILKADALQQMFTALEPSASEVVTGTATNKAITPNALRDSNLVPKSIVKVGSTATILSEVGGSHTASVNGSNVYTITLPFTAASTDSLWPLVQHDTTIGADACAPNLEVISTSQIKVEFINISTGNASVRRFTLIVYADE